MKIKALMIILCLKAAEGFADPVDQAFLNAQGLGDYSLLLEYTGNKSPDTNAIHQIRQAFEQLPRPLLPNFYYADEVHNDDLKAPFSLALPALRVVGDTAINHFLETYTNKTDVAYALWPYLGTEKDGDATILLIALGQDVSKFSLLLCSYLPNYPTPQKSFWNNPKDARDAQLKHEKIIKLKKHVARWAIVEKQYRLDKLEDKSVLEGTGSNQANEQNGTTIIVEQMDGEPSPPVVKPPPPEP